MMTVPQVSVLGPLLFLVTVGDIDSNLKAQTSFTDDTRVKMKNEAKEDVALLPEISSMLQWVENNMTLNSEKFEVLQYGHLQDIKDLTHYNVHQEDIAVKEHIQDLGVYMSNDLTFHWTNG